MAPLIEVAWADGRLDSEERGIVLAAAKRSGFGRTSYELLMYWLEEPSDELMTVWREYVAVALDSMPLKDRTSFAENRFNRAKQVSEATGGVLGLGKISRMERDVLNEIGNVLA